MQCITFGVERVDSVTFDVAHPAEIASFSAHLEPMTFSAERVCSISEAIEGNLFTFDGKRLMTIDNRFLEV